MEFSPLYEALRLIKRQTELENAMQRPGGGDSRHRGARALPASSCTHIVSGGGDCHHRDGVSYETAS